MREFLRKIISTIVRILLTPFRIIAWPFRKVQDFINFEPEDTPTSDVLVRTFEQPSILLEHIGVLRKHLFRAVVVLFIATGFSFAFASQILDLLAEPIGGIDSLQAIEVTESIGAFMRVSLLSGFTLAFPYILFEIFTFVNPGLKKRERVFILASLPFAALLFISGLAFAYFIMLEPALDFLLEFMGINTVPRPSNYIRFVTNLMFWIGIAFQLPLVIYTLASIGVVRAETLARGWRIAIIGIAVLAAFVTPTVDPVNMGLVMLPMIVLYFVSLILAKIAQRARDRRQA